MAELLQEYELSIWHDANDSNVESIGRFIEKKVAVIGSNSLITPTKAYNVSLKENVNGEKTLTFSLPRAYRDKDGELKDNPFLSLLTAERKLKLREGPEYNYFTGENGVFNPEEPSAIDSEERWSDFIIKTVDEDKESYVNNYTCKEAHVNELGKNGWSVLLDGELGNNYGTLPELAEAILDGSGWTVDYSGEVPAEKVAEPLFYTVYTSTAGAAPTIGTHLIDGKASTDTVRVGDYLYTFYSQLTMNSEGHWIIKGEHSQILWNKGQSLDDFPVDDNRTIVDEDHELNYLISKEGYEHLIWTPTGGDVGKSALQGGRLVESVQSHYEPVAARYVDEYHVRREYFDKIGLPEDIVLQYYVPEEEKDPDNAYTAAYPDDYMVYHYSDTEILTSDSVQNYVANASNYTTLAGWQLKEETVEGLGIKTLAVREVESQDGSVHLTAEPPTEANWDDARNFLVLPPQSVIYNEGLTTNNFFLSPGDEYRFKIKAFLINNNTDSTDAYVLNHIGNLIRDGVTVYVGYKTLDGQIHDISSKLNFTPRTTDDKEEFEGTLRIADDIEDSYGHKPVLVIENPDNYAVDGTDKDYRWCVGDIQLFDLILNDEGEIIRPGDIPEAKAIIRDRYYIPWLIDGKQQEYFLLSDNQCYKANIREGFAAVRHIDLKESNYFNNINNLAELFEVWAKFKTVHCKDGSLYRGADENAIKQVRFTRFTSGDDEYNWAGFKYGINLKSIKRTVESSNVASKVIVKNNNNEFAPAGMGSISRAADNITGENTVFNFDYYIAHGLLEQSAVINDLYGTTSNHFSYFRKLRTCNDKLLPLNQTIVEMQSALDSAQQMYDYCSVEVEAARGELALQKNYYDQTVNIFKNEDGATEEEKLDHPSIKAQALAVASAKASLNSFLRDQTTYGRQIVDYQAKLNPDEYSWRGGVSYSATFDPSSPATSIVRYVLPKQKTDGTKMDWWICRTSHTSLYPPTENNVHWVRLGEKLFDQEEQTIIKCLPISAQADYWTRQKQLLHKTFYKKYFRYIQEATWTDEKYMDDNLYYYDAIKVSSQNAWPKTKYTISVVDVSGVEKLAAYKFKIGQKSYIEDTEFFGYENVTVKNGNEYFTVKTPKKKEVVVSERTRNFDDPSKSTLTIQTYKNQFEELFSKLTSTTQSLQYASGEYQRAANVVKSDGSIAIESIEQAFANNAFMLANASNQLVSWNSGTGIQVSDAKNPLQVVRVTSAGIAMTSNGGNSWTLGITAGGINTSLLTAGTITADKIRITSSTDTSASFSWTEKGISAYKAGTTGNSFVRLDQHGLYGTVRGLDLDEAIAQAGSFEAALDAIRRESTFSLTWEGLLLRSQDGATSVSPHGGLEVFHRDRSGDWVFDASYIASHAPIGPDGNPYVAGDLIPILSIGKFYNSLSERIYGMRMRNSDGEITLQTDGATGNLWLRDSIRVGGDDYQNATAGIARTIEYTEGEESIAKDFAFWAGQEEDGDFTFCVDYDGHLTANDATIRGVIYARDGDFSGNIIARSGQIVGALSVGNAAGINDDPFTEDSPLAFWAGPTVETDDSTLQKTFSVDYDGHLVANSAEIRGRIVADSGSFNGRIDAREGSITWLSFGLQENGIYTSEIGQSPNSEALSESSPLLSIHNKNFLVKANGDLYANKAFLHYLGGDKTDSNNYAIHVNNNGDILTVYKRTETETEVKIEKMFALTPNGDITMAGTLKGDGLAINGDIELKGAFIINDDSGTRIRMSGENGGMIQGNSTGNIIGGWTILGDGTAEFDNVKVRGTLTSVVFEMDKTSYVGGTLLLAPSITIVEDPKFTEDKRSATISISKSAGIAWESVSSVEVHSLSNTGEPHKDLLDGFRAVYNEEDLTLTITADNELNTILVKGAQLVSTDKAACAIELTANDSYGPRILMSHKPADSPSAASTVILGSLYAKDLNLTNTPFSDLADENGGLGYGLYADNAYITGHILLPKVGLTNSNDEESNIFNYDNWKEAAAEVDDSGVISDSLIRFWAGADPSSRQKAPLIITEDGSLYANKGVFRGQVIARNSSFSGEISAAGIVLSHENSTDADDEHQNFYVKWRDEPNTTDEGCPHEFDIADFNAGGLSLFRGLEYKIGDNSGKTVFKVLGQDSGAARIAATQIQTYDGATASAILTKHSLIFKTVNDASTTDYAEGAESLYNNGAYAFGLWANSNGGTITTKQLTIETPDGNNTLQMREDNSVTIYGEFNYHDTMRVTTVEDGIIFNFVGNE